MPGAILGTGDRVMDKTDKNLFPLGVYTLGMEFHFAID